MRRDAVSAIEWVHAGNKSQLVLIDTAMASIKSRCIDIPMRRLPLNLMVAMLTRESHD
jgi:hypothetical protein